MRVFQALKWFRDERSSLDAAVNGIVRHLSRDPNREKIVQDLRDNIHAVPARRSPASSPRASRTRIGRRRSMQQTFVEILRSSVDDRRALFSMVAAHLETRAENVEKDLYVCWVNFLFNRRPNDRSVSI